MILEDKKMKTTAKSYTDKVKLRELKCSECGFMIASRMLIPRCKKCGTYNKPK